MTTSSEATKIDTSKKGMSTTVLVECFDYRLLHVFCASRCCEEYELAVVPDGCKGWRRTLAPRGPKVFRRPPLAWERKEIDVRVTRYVTAWRAKERADHLTWAREFALEDFKEFPGDQDREGRYAAWAADRAAALAGPETFAEHERRKAEEHERRMAEYRARVAEREAESARAACAPPHEGSMSFADVCSGVDSDSDEDIPF